VCAIRVELESFPAGEVPSLLTCIGFRAAFAAPRGGVFSDMMKERGRAGKGSDQHWPVILHHRISPECVEFKSGFCQTSSSPQPRSTRCSAVLGRGAYSGSELAGVPGVASRLTEMDGMGVRCLAAESTRSCDGMNRYRRASQWCVNWKLYSNRQMFTQT
jgi:hypothetical protein